MSSKACKILLPAMSGLAALAFALAAGAHGSMKPDHGGVVQMSGETQFELVNAPGGVALYLEEDEEDVPSAGAAATLTIRPASGRTSTVVMTAAGGNRFEAKGLKLAPGSEVGVMVVDKKTKARSSTTYTIK